MTHNSTLMINSMVQAQLAYPGLAVGYIDIERTWDWQWAVANGLDRSRDRFMKLYPEGSEDVSDQMRDMCETGLFSLIVVDSIGGMESKRALSKDAEEYDVGRNAQIITRMVKNTASLAERHEVAVLFVNQPRANIGSFTGGDISAGPKSFRHSTTIKIKTSRTGIAPLTTGSELRKEEVGVQIRAKVDRSKVAPSGPAAEFWIMKKDTPQYGPIGIDRADEAVTVGVLLGVIRQGGGNYTLPGLEKPIKGKDAVKEYLRVTPEALAEVRAQIISSREDEVTPATLVNFDPDELEAS